MLTGVFSIACDRAGLADNVHCSDAGPQPQGGMFMYKHALKFAFGFLVLFGVVGVQVSSADTLQNCATCGGVVYTLTTAPDVGLGTGWYDFKLQVNTSGISVSTAQVLNAVALKVPGATNAQLLSESTGTWTMVVGGTNNSSSGTGCVPNSKNGFDCAQATATFAGTGTADGVPTGTNTLYTFTFAFLLPSAPSGDLASGVGLKAYYDTTSGTFGGLQTSDTFGSPAPVPEPGTLTLLVAGLAVAGLFALKRR